MLVTTTSTSSSTAFQSCSSNFAPQSQASLAGRDVHRPNLIRPMDRQSFQQVRINLMRGICDAGVALTVNGRDAHLLHQRVNMPAANLETFQLEHIAQHAAAS